jgi:uncharacterized protein YwqG
VLTAEDLERNVTGLVVEGVALPEWWRSGKPPEQKDRLQGGGGIMCARVDEGLRQFLAHERNLEEGKRLAAAGPGIDEIRRQLDPWVRSHARPAWKPVTQDGDGNATASKFAGVPWLAADEKWPVCQACGKPLKLFVQINLDELPPDDTRGTFGKGLLQFFFCTGSEDGQCDARTYEPFGKGKLVRVVQPEGPGQAAPRLPRGALPSKRIVDWRRVEDHPNSQEHEELGLSYKFDHQHRTARIDCPSLALVFENAGEEAPEAISDAATGDKLGGWPAWVQGAAYPNCPRCGKRMRLVFQLDSNDNLPFMFGDVGCGQIMQCPEHHDVVTFIWDCS